MSPIAVALWLALVVVLWVGLVAGVWALVSASDGYAPESGVATEE